MSSMLILKDSYIIDERKFNETFLVIGEKELYWQFYPSEASVWTTGINHQKTKIEGRDIQGERQLTLIHTGQDYEISCVLPTWEFSINGSKLPKGFYGTFIVAWKEVKLAYLGYEFVFTFDISDNANIDFPKPLYRAGD